MINKLIDIEKHYQDLIENASDLIQCINSTGKFVYVNKVWMEKLGYNVNEIENISLWDIIHPDSMEHCQKTFIRVMSGDDVGYIEAIFRTKSGSEIYVEGNVNCKVDCNGNIISTRGIFRDVSSQKKLEKEILKNIRSLERYNKLQKVMLDISESFVSISNESFNEKVKFALEKLGNAIGVDRVYICERNDENDSYNKIYEWCEKSPQIHISNCNTLEEIKNLIIENRGLKTIFFDALSDKTNESVRKILQTNEIKSLLVVPIAKDEKCYGMIAFDSIHNTKKYSEDETHLLLQFSNMFISAQKRIQSEIELNRSEAKYKSLIENLSEIVYILNKKGEIEYISSNISAVGGYLPEEIIGRNFIEFVYSDDKTSRKEEFLKTLRGKTRPTEYRLLTKGKRIVWVRTNGKPIIENGIIIGVQGVLTDITDLKIMAKELIENRNFLNTALESIQEGMAVINEDFSVEYMNPTIKRWNIEGYNYENKKCYEILKSRKASCEKCIKKLCLDSGKPQHAEKKIITSEGEKWVEVYCYPFIGNDQEQRKVVEFIRDITDRKKIENSLFHEKEQFRTTLLSVGDAVISVDSSQKVVMMNKVAELLTGYTLEEAVGKDFNDIFDLINEFTKEKCENPVSYVLATGKTIEISNNVMLVSKDGIKRPIEKSASPIKDIDGETTGVVLVFRDFTEKKQKQNEILYLSYHDQLTGLYNRRFFEEEIKRIDKAENYPLTIVMLDVNGLKLVNDAFGHLVGDRLLQVVADILTKNTRIIDTVARIGGDEFVIILPSTQTDELMNIIKAISDEISSKRLQGMYLSVSYGWETKTDTSNEIMDIFKKAEDHMYRRKLSESQSMRHSAVNVILKTLYEKSQREEMHSKRVSELCAKLGKAMGLGKEEINEMKTAGLMHDIGKIIIPDDVLNKTESLTASEWLTMKRHPETGYKILSSVNEFAPLAKEVLQHHERWDGKGYPEGLKGEEIEMRARIIAIADAYDAMTSDRPYRKGISKQDAIEEIKQNAGTQFDPSIAEEFIKIIDSL